MGNFTATIINTRIIALLIIAITTSGCAHKRLIDDGEQFQRNGRYEQAIKSYQKALAMKPNDHKTQQKLATAQLALDKWLDTIEQAAEQAKAQGLNGRALLLYSKVAQLRRDQQAQSAYKALFQQLQSQSRYHLKVTGSAQLGQHFATPMADVTIINSVDPNSSNHFNLNVNITAPQFDSQTQQKDVTKSYVSGTKTIANPKFHHLQDIIADNRQQLESYQNDYDNKLVDADHALYQLNAAEKDLEIAQLRLNQAVPNSSDYHYWRNEISRIKSIVTNKRDNYDHIRYDLDNINRNIENSRNELDSALNELSYLTPTVEQEIYSDHHYQIQQHTRTASGTLTVQFTGNNHNFKRSKTIHASDSDQSHQAQPILGLKANGIELQSDQQITRQYYANAKEQARIAIKQHLNDYRKRLRNQVNQSIGIDQQLENAVIYGLSGSDGVDSSTERNMQTQLQQEFGITGDFDINRLLYLFGG